MSPLVNPYLGLTVEMHAKLPTYILFFAMQPVSHNVKVDHHPAGGHWFPAGLSPNVSNSVHLGCLGLCFRSDCLIRGQIMYQAITNRIV